MKSKLSNALIALALLAGFSLILYPAVSDYVNSKHQTRAIQSYEETVSSGMSEETIEEFKKIAQNEGIKYQTLIRSILEDFIEKYK